MRKICPGYYRPTEEEFKELWQNCLFVFDSNVLLNLYRYSAKTCSELLDIMKKVSNRVWIPHQVALEYHKNRLSEIANQKKAYYDINKIIEDFLNKLQNDLNKFLKHPLIDINPFINNISSLFAEMKDKLKEQENIHPDLIQHDDIRGEITVIFDDKVGKIYNEESLDNIYKEGEKRYQKKIPPGYSDLQKQAPEKYGDLILWRQLIDKAKECQQPIIFVTDDAKEDWWWKYGDNITIGPRPELIEEMLFSAGVNFYMYRSDKFMEYSRQYLEQDIEENAITEVRELGEIEIADNRTFYENMIRSITNESVKTFNEINKLIQERDIYQENIYLFQKEISFISGEINELKLSRSIENDIKINELMNRYHYLKRELNSYQEIISDIYKKIDILKSKDESYKRLLVDISV